MKIIAALALVQMLALPMAVQAAPSGKELAFVKKFFNSIQQSSFRQNREYCGYFGLDAAGNFIATKAKRGRQDSCWPDDPGDLDIFASYHTHGAFSIYVDSELPSAQDLAADIEEELDGYIATPGGRVWFNDSAQARTTLICGDGCVLADPTFDADLLDPTKKRYTLNQLIQRDTEQ